MAFYNFRYWTNRPATPQRLRGFANRKQPLDATLLMHNVLAAVMVSGSHWQRVRNAARLYATMGWFCFIFMQSASTVITELLQFIAVQCIIVKIHIFNTVQCGRAVKVIHNQVDLGGNDTPAMAVLIVLCLFVCEQESVSA